MVKSLLSNAGGAGSIRELRSYMAPGQKKKTPKNIAEANCNKFNKDFKNGPHQIKLFLVFTTC